MARTKRDDGAASPKKEKTVFSCTPHERKVMKAAAREILEAMAAMEPFKAKIAEARGSVKGLGIKMKQFNVALAIFDLERDDQAEALEGLKKAFEALELGGTVNFIDVLQAEPANDSAPEEQGDAGGVEDEVGQEADDAVVGDEPAGDGDPVPAGDGEETILAPEADHGEVGAAPATDEELDEAGKTHKAGFDAGYAGADFETNPHKKGRVPYKLWAKGWEAGSTKRLGEQDAATREPAVADIVDGAVGALDDVVAGMQANGLSAETAAAGSA